MPFATPTDLVASEGGLLYGLAKWAYNVTDGAFWTLMLAGFCIVMFMAVARYGTSKAYAYASLVGLFGSIFFIVLGLMPYWLASIFIINGAVGFAVLIVSGFK